MEGETEEGNFATDHIEISRQPTVGSCRHTALALKERLPPVVSLISVWKPENICGCRSMSLHFHLTF